MGGLTLRSEVMPSEIDKRPPDLSGGEPEELTRRGRLDFSKRPVEPHGGPLKHVISLLPTPEMWIVTQHLSRQTEKTIGRLGDQLAISTVITLTSPVEERLELCRVPVSFTHAIPNAAK